MRRIELRRDGKTITTFDLYDLIDRGDKSKDVPLLPGDILYFPQAGPRVAVLGSVERPAIYELKGPAQVSQVLNLAGGITRVASNQDAEILRIEDHKLRHVIEINLEGASMNAPLESGDVLRVLSMVPRFDNAVVLRGNVANPGTYAWHQGMRVKDLVPDRDSLLTRDYWRQRARLGLPVLDYAPSQVNNPDAAARTTFQQHVVTGNDVQQAAADRASVSQGFGQAANSGASLRANPNPANGSVLGAANALSQQNVAGNATAAGAAPPLAQRFPPRNNVELQDPDINWSYAVIERTSKATLQTELLPFNLGALVEDNDQSQNLELQPGDVVTIFSQADFRVPRQQQTRLVHIEGEVVHGGVYSVQPGETLRQVVERAGGLTPNAYLYGASFTRESVRQQQQQRLDEYVNQLAKDLQHSSAQAAANGAGNGAQVQQQGLDQIRALRASGRVVLNIRPADHDLAAIPDIPLEDGDHLLVPPLPSSVNVVGSVYNQSSFVFENGRREGDYLRQAGGPDRLADRSHEYIVRADGSVVSRSFTSGKLLASFDAEHIYPGDTIIVPQKLIHVSPLQQFLAYSSVFSTLALTAATIAILQ
jgi:protein involved in polysaccharide export with SLBB domain